MKYFVLNDNFFEKILEEIENQLFSYAKDSSEERIKFKKTCEEHFNKAELTLLFETILNVCNAKNPDFLIHVYLAFSFLLDQFTPTKESEETLKKESFVFLHNFVKANVKDKPLMQLKM